MNEAAPHNTLLTRLVPPVAAVVAIAAFCSLGFWQLDRAAEKEALAAKFADDAPFRELGNNDPTIPFERIEVRGRELGERQVLIDNIVRDGRIGYFVVTPVELSDSNRLLLVNRGWVDKRNGPPEDSFREGVTEWGRFRGRVGQLPRVGIRSGEAFEGSEDWPRIAVYPTLDEVAAELQADLMPFVLLLDPDEPGEYLRRWEPAESGPMTHYGYAFQWFAMALTVLAIGAWHLKKRLKSR